MRLRRNPGLAAIAVMTVSLTLACSGSSLDPTKTAAGELVVGLIVPQTGPYKAIGDDQIRGWELYLKQHGNQLGGHPIKVVTADEGAGGASARAAVDKLIKSDGASVLVGTADAQAVSAIAAVVTEAKVPFVAMGGRPSTLADISSIWHTSFLSTDYGKAVGETVAQTIAAPVYVIGPNNQGGRDQLGGFVEAFTAAGGRLANTGGIPAFVEVADTNFGPWLTQITDTGAKAVYAFFAGPSAVGFVKQYQAFGLNTVPVYGPAFLTEGAVLGQQGAAADGVYTVANYAPGLDNPINQDFAKTLSAAHPGTTPNIYHVTAFDAAAVLDKAIANAGAKLTPQAINAAIGQLGAIDSPRGTWTFHPSTHTPAQHWFLRQVQNTGGTRSNVVLKDLGSQ